MLVRVHSGVYRSAAAPATFEAALWVAVLATAGVLVGSTAAWLWGMLEDDQPRITVAVAHGRNVIAPPGVRVIRSDRLAAHFTRRHGLPTSNRRDAAVEHIASQPRPAATLFADRAVQCRWITAADLERRLDQRVPGNGVVRRVLRTLSSGAEAESERQLHRLLRDAGISGWRANVAIRIPSGGVVRPDVLFESLRLVIEVDGFRYHSKNARYQADRTKQNALVLLGYTVLRFTWEDIHQRPEYVIDQIVGALRCAA